MYEEKGLTEWAINYQPWLPLRKGLGLGMSQVTVVLVYIIYVPVLRIFLKKILEYID